VEELLEDGVDVAGRAKIAKSGVAGLAPGMIARVVAPSVNLARKFSAEEFPKSLCLIPEQIDQS
jgi:hypothetical protein